MDGLGDAFGGEEALEESFKETAAVLVEGELIEVVVVVEGAFFDVTDNVEVVVVVEGVFDSVVVVVEVVVEVGDGCWDFIDGGGSVKYAK